jgi:hypothetical protein
MLYPRENHEMPRYPHEMLFVNIWRSEDVMNGFPHSNFVFQITDNCVYFSGAKGFENYIQKLYSTNYLQLRSRDDIATCLGFSLGSIGI